VTIAVVMSTRLGAVSDSSESARRGLRAPP
jgi:hypothetical protein